MSDWGYRRRPNPAAPNTEFHGKKGRSAELTMVVLHTADVEPDFTFPDSSGDRVSGSMAEQAGPGRSWHATVDADAVIHEIPSGWAADHVPGWNSRTIGITLATDHHLWDRLPASHVRRLLDNTAKTTAWYCKKYNLPVGRVRSLDEARSGRRGIVGADVLDPACGRQPGQDFPWDEFLARVRGLVGADVIVGIGDSGTKVSEIQGRLTELGYGDLVGPIDAQAGPRFDDAVRAYEADRGMARTGLWIPSLARVNPPSGINRNGRMVDIEASVGEGGINRREDVAVIAERLDELGFLRPARCLAHCVRLFQTATGGREHLDSVDGRIDPGRGTHAWLNAVNAPRWRLLPDGSESEGFRRRVRLERDDDRGWGTNWLIDKLRRAAAVYKASYLDRVPDGPLIWTGDASAPHGGPDGPRDSHQAGLHLDLMLPPQTAGSWGLTIDDDAYDRDAARAMIQAFRRDGGIDTVYLNDQALIDEGLCQQANGHDDRIHLHIRPPDRIDA